MMPALRKVSCLATIPLAAALAACSPRSGDDDLLADPGYSLYALVSTIDGTSFGPPLGPTIEPAGAFDATLLARLQVVLEAEDGAGHVTTLGTFGASTEPGLRLLAPHELYWMNVPAAAYFTDPALAYRFRALLDGREIGRSDMSSRVFEVLRYVPNLPVGVKLRLETRPTPSVASLTPATLVAGSSNFTLTVLGAGFVHDSTITFAGESLATTWVSATELRATVPATAIAAVGTSSVLVATPAPGGGTSSAATFTAESPVPTLTSMSPVRAILGASDLALTLTGASFVPTAHATFAGVPLATTFTSSTQLVATIPAALFTSAGTKAVTVVNPDPGGPSARLDFTVESPAPVLTALTPASATVGAAATTITLTGASFVPGAVVTFGGAALATTFVGSTQLTAVIPAASLASGGTVAVQVANPAPVAAPSATRSFTVSYPVPVLATLTPSSATAGDAYLVLTIDGSSFAPNAQATFNNTDVVTTFVSSTRLTALVTPALLASAGTFDVSVLHAAPNLGAATPLTFAVDNATPTLTTLTPASAVAGNGAFTLTVDGTRFVSGAVVSFAGTPLTSTFVSSARLTATVPAALVASTASPVVTVTNPAPSAGASAALTFVVQNAAPVLTSFAPTGATAGDAATTLTITGSSFVPGAVVTFDATALATTFVSSTRLTAAIPAASLTTGALVSLQVQNPAPSAGASATRTFTVSYPVPVLAALTPSSATAGDAGLTLTIDGASLVTGAQATFNGTTLATTLVSATRLTALLPPSLLATAGSFNVLVAYPTPNLGAASPRTFTVNNAIPTISALTPSSITAGSAAFTLTVDGTRFLSGTTVSLAGAALTTTFASSTRVTAAVPASFVATNGSFGVTAANPAPTTGASASATLTVTSPAPVLTSIAPAAAVAGGATFTLTLNGTSFTSATYATFNGAALTTTYVSAAQVTASVPAASIAASGTYNVTAVTPAPGGGTSAAQTFTVSAACTGTFTSCSSVPATCPSGVYSLRPQTGVNLTAYCDMTTAGGGWTLVLAYAHTGGQNNALVAGTAPTSPTTGYSHMSTTQLQALPFNEMRLYCQTSGHSRKVDFRTSSTGAINYFKGTVNDDVTYWTSGATYLYDHGGRIPGGAGSVINVAASTEARMTEFPFYIGSANHWGIRGGGGRWECDDYTNSAGNTTLHQVWVRDTTQPRPRTYANCSDILAAGASHGSGVYDTVGGQVYCDMTTDGGGWMLVLAYQHAGGQNAALVPGVPPLGPTTSYSHLSQAVLGQLTYSETKFDCSTSNHTRQVHFKTSATGAIRYMKGLADNTAPSWNTGFTALAGHTANLPAAANYVYSDALTSETRLTDFPFYMSGAYHWAIQGGGSRWECDDYTNSPVATTNHQIWIRDALCHNGVQDPGESGIDCGGTCSGLCTGSCAAQGTFTSCSAIPAGCSSGIYSLRPASTTYQAFCDTTTAGGGWMLGLAYAHFANDNAALVSGTFPLDPYAGYSHLTMAQLQAFSWTTMRLYCQSSGHSRIVHFTTNVAGAAGYFRGTGANQASYWNTSFTPLSGHTGVIPAGAGYVFSQGATEDHMTEFPFYRSGSNHWALRGQGSRWECDDYAGGPGNTTLHQVWFR